MGPEPEIFVPPSDEGARGNNDRGPGTTVNPVNTQFSDLGRLSWPKRAEINACLNFPPFLHFLTPNKAGNFSGTIFCQTGKTIENIFSDPRNEIKWIRSKQAQFPRKKRVRVPNKGRGSDLDRSADLVSPVNDFHFPN